MPITISQAEDRIKEVFREAWESQVLDPGENYPPVEWDNIEKLENPPNTGWARFNLTHTTSTQATLGEVGGRRFRRFGVIIIQIFVASGTGTSRSTRLADTAINAYEGKSDRNDTIEFRNVRKNEIGVEGPWYQVNVIAEFNYDAVK